MAFFLLLLIAFWNTDTMANENASMQEQWQQDSKACIAYTEQQLMGETQEYVEKYAQRFFYDCLAKKGYNFDTKK